MLPLLAAILLASLLGSWHCAGMCGAFVALATGQLTGDVQPSFRRATHLQAAYHAGRLTTYAALGAAAGAAGGLLNLAGALAGMRTAATVLAAATLTGVGVLWLLRAYGIQLSHARRAVPWAPVIQRLHRWAMNYPPMSRAYLIGFLTTLLPCGWLYAFAITAAGTGHALTGALVMATFWAGTLPALAAVGAGARKVMGSLSRRMPVVTALLVIVAGLWTVASRAHLDPLNLVARAQARATAAMPTADKAACCTESHGSHE